ncbi:hypothetical protein PCANB_001001 [Pneumocystis canis]|nr:hypothetical protein PCANB_001001 [Pneumocystis canis]
MSIKPYQERKDLESALKHELKGGLGEITHCNYKLDDYCIKWAETGNHTLINLCRELETTCMGNWLNKVRKLSKILPAELKDAETELK